MIEYKSGDLFNEDVEALVNTVNCVGVMGRGIALQFKRAFPDNFKTYAAACKREEVKPGKMFVFATNQMTNPRYIINFPTKRHWRGKSRLSDIETGLNALVQVIQELEIRSIALPPLGSGLGGLNWGEVRERLSEVLTPVEGVKVVIFEPRGAPAAEAMAKSKKTPRMTIGRATLICLMQRYLAGLLDPFVSLLEVHKLMYFMQEAGQNLKLKYRPAFYGPYAEELRHVLRHIEGHFTSGYADGGDDPGKLLEIVPGAVEDALAFLERHEDTRERLQRVANLVEGFETPSGLELLSTVHWVAHRKDCRTQKDVIHGIYAWSNRKRQFSEYQIGVALWALNREGWLPQNLTLN